VATGAHDGVAAFPGNDLPGVVSARAAALLARHGIAIGRKVGLVGTGPYSASLVEALGNEIETIAVDDPKSIAAEGRRRVTAMTIRRGERHAIDALVVEVPGSPSFELAEQAGAKVTFDPAHSGYVPEIDENGRVAISDGSRCWVWCAGEAAGTGPMLSEIEAQAERVAADIARALQ
jgi:sarcosine oxidase subunit alpha